MKIGFIGIGMIGEPVATHLVAKGHDVAVFDVVPARLDRVVAKGARRAVSAADAARGAEAVVTSLPGPAQVLAVAEPELLGAMERGSAWVDMSTTDRHQTLRLAERFAARGITTIEAGCTGGVDAAWQGHVTLFIGAADADYRLWKPLLDDLGDRVFHMGPLGAGMVTKLITNMMCFTQQQTLAESLGVGVKAGLDPARVLDAIRASYATSFIADTDGPKILDGSYDPTFAVGLVAKDARLGLAMAKEVGAPLRLFPLMAEGVERALAAYGAEAGNLVPARLYEDAAGVSFRARGKS